MKIYRNNRNTFDKVFLLLFGCVQKFDNEFVPRIIVYSALQSCGLEEFCSLVRGKDVPTN
jgi:hypothetical protein